MKKFTFYKVVILFFVFFASKESFSQSFENETIQKTDSNSFLIEGVLIDQEKERLAGVSVQLKGFRNKVYSDFNGRYTLRIPIEFRVKDYFLILLNYMGDEREMKVCPIFKGNDFQFKEEELDIRSCEVIHDNKRFLK